MSVLPARAPQTAALIAWLETQLQFPIGKGKAPDGAGWQGPPGLSDFIGYGVVHSIPGGTLDGDLTQPACDGELPWQVDAVGGNQDQAEKIADLLQAALLGPLPPLAIDGRTVQLITEDIPHGAAREDPDQPSIWRCVGRYLLATTPTT